MSPKGVRAMPKTIRVDDEVYEEISHLATSLRMSISGLASNLLKATLREAKREAEKAKEMLNPLFGPAEAEVEGEERTSSDWLWIVGIIALGWFLLRRRGGVERGTHPAPAGQ